MPLQGTVAIVTGASGSIGSATVRALAARGANVVAAALPDSLLEALAGDLQQQHVPVLIVPTDVTKRSEVDRLVSKTCEVFGRIDVLAYLAGVGSSPSLCDMTPEELERVVAVNLTGAAHAMHAVLPVMKAQRSGAIVNVGSVAGETGVMGIYSASKFGLRGLTDSVRREVRSQNIGVTLIEPGFVRSAMNPEMRDGLLAPEIIADAIVAAIARPRRVRVIPARYSLAIWLTQLFPGVTDLVFGNARIQERMNRDSRATRAAKGTDGKIQI